MNMAKYVTLQLEGPSLLMTLKTCSILHYYTHCISCQPREEERLFTVTDIRDKHYKVIYINYR